MGDHERLLRAAWADAEGRELDADGDSFFVAFRRPRQAVDAAVAAQRALAAHDWPEEWTCASGSACTRARRRPRATSTSGSPSTAPRGSATPATAGRSSSPRPPAPCSRTRRPSSTASSCATSATTCSRTSTGPCASTSWRSTDLPAEFPALRTAAGEGAAQLADRQDELAATGPAQSTAGGAVRVLIVDDQALVRTGFKMILEAEPDLEVVGEAADGQEALTQARSLSAGRRPDGRPDARARRDRGDAAAARGRRSRGEGRDADHLRHGRVRLRGAAGGRERLPAQGRPAGAARRRHPRRRERRRAARALGDEAA